MFTTSASMAKISFLLLSAFFWLSLRRSSYCGAIIVQTNSGLILGKTYETLNRKKAHVFLGVPYAKPPTGNRRFQLPEKVDKWEGIVNVTEKRAHCVQFWTYYNKSMEESEDCLFNNIIVPYKGALPAPANSFPVLVWIHGGSFSAGSANEYFLNGTIDNFVAGRDIIFVAINYRLGIFGYLNSVPNKLHGNYGVADQIMAIDWIYDNIEYFGGNKSLITLAGQSSGAASAHLVGLSNSNKPFNNIIALSGSAPAPWAVRTLNTRLNSDHVVKRVCPTEKERESIVRCLQSKEAKHFQEAWHYIKTREMSGLMDPEYGKFYSNAVTFSKSYFTPVVDSMRGLECILCSEVEILLKQTPAKPIIFGFTSLEMNAIASFLDYLEEENHNFMDLSLFLPSNIYQNHDAVLRFKTLSISVREAVRKEYMADYDVQSSNLRRLILKIGSDQLFTAPAIYSASVQSKKAKMFVYSFNMTKEELFIPSSFRDGASHGFDIVFMFASSTLVQPYAEEKNITWTFKDKRVVDFLTDSIHRFMLTGDPNYVSRSNQQQAKRNSTFWPNFWPDSPTVMSISDGKFNTYMCNIELMRFWSNKVPELSGEIDGRIWTRDAFYHHGGNHGMDHDLFDGVSL